MHLKQNVTQITFIALTIPAVGENSHNTSDQLHRSAHEERGGTPPQARVGST